MEKVSRFHSFLGAWFKQKKAMYPQRSVLKIIVKIPRILLNIQGNTTSTLLNQYREMPMRICQSSLLGKDDA